MDRRFIITLVIDLFRKKHGHVETVDVVKLLVFYNNWLLTKVRDGMSEYISGYNRMKVGEQTYTITEFINTFYKIKEGVN